MIDHIIKVESTEKLLNAAKIMIENKIGALIVMKDSKAVGMLTERDILKAFVGDETNQIVENYMSSPLITIEAKSRLGSATQLMMMQKIRRLPVTDDNGEIIGFINLRDLMSAIHNSFITLFNA